MVKASKRYRSAREVTDLTTSRTLEEAVQVLSQFPKPKFDETVELSANLGVDPRQSSQMVRGTVNLPNGSGKKVTVAVFTENAQEALDAGADHAGLDDLIKKVQDGWMDFDVAIATTSAMKQVRTVARVLGPRGLMPNPKSGTVTDDIPAGINAVKAGRVEFKMDKTGNLSIVVGKRSFTNEQIAENARTIIGALNNARPDEFKGKYIKSMTLTATMSPGVKLDPAEYTNS